MTSEVAGVGLVLALGAFGGFLIGNYVPPSHNQKESFISEHHDKPFCVDVDMVDGKKKRCWRAVEVTP